MHSYSEIIGVIAGIIAFLNIIPYAISTLKGITKPSRAAYAIWLVIDVVTALSYFASGARDTVYAFIGFALTTLLMFILSIKYGMGGLNKLDIICMLIGFAAIFLWVVTENPLLTLYASLFAKIVGYIPIAKKAYSHPETEDNLAWAMTAIASVLNVAALNSLKPELSVAPISLAIIDVAITLLLLFPARRISEG